MNSRRSFDHLVRAGEQRWLKVDVIVTQGSPPTLAAKKATATIPIVSVVMGDPVGNNLVASLARPGGNLTGFSIQTPDIAGKRLELLREIVPGLRRVAFMGNIDNPIVPQELKPRVMLSPGGTPMPAGRGAYRWCVSSNVRQALV